MPRSSTPPNTPPPNTPLDDERLEEAYAQALAHEKAGQFEQAADFYRRALMLDAQDHAGAAVRLAAIGHGETPKSASKAYVTTLFDQHADVFDMILVDQLRYDVPQQLRLLLEHFPKSVKQFSDKKCDKNKKLDQSVETSKTNTALDEMKENAIFEHMLDLGCGTGLAAEALIDKAQRKTGVDLAENMIAVAYEKELYDSLFVGDVVQFLAQEDEDVYWDLITATDVLPYMGELEKFFTLVARHLTPSGLFGFSSETLDASQFDSVSYKVSPYSRFAHQSSYIEACLHQAGLYIVASQAITVRQEQGKPAQGQLFLAAHK